MLSLPAMTSQAITLTDRHLETYAPQDPTLIERLHGKGVSIKAEPPSSGTPTLIGILISWFPMLLLIGVWIFFHAPSAIGIGEGDGLWPISGAAFI